MILLFGLKAHHYYGFSLLRALRRSRTTIINKKKYIFFNLKYSYFMDEDFNKNFVKQNYIKIIFTNYIRI